MIPLTVATASAETEPVVRKVNPWMASLVAGLVTALLAVLFVFLFQTENPVLYIIGYLLIGAGPVIGYGLPSGRLGSSVPAMIGGILSFILPALSIFLWPILVGALERTQSIGSLLVGSLIGAILAIVVFLLMGTFLGQDPMLWFAPAVVLLFSVWGGSCGAAMAAWAKE
jgi:hypothetical protein